MYKALSCCLAALALLAQSAPPAAPAVLPQARAALEDGQFAASIALAGPWAAINPEAADLAARAHMAWAEAIVRDQTDAEAARRDAIDQLAIAMGIAPEGALRDGLSARMAELARAADPTPAAEAPTPPATPTAIRPHTTRPTPQPRRAYSVTQRKSFEGSGESGQFASCVDVQVVDKGGPVAGAVIGVNNGEHSYQSQTDASGYTGRCGLGASIWSVVLFWAPGSGESGATTTVYLSGAPEQRAAVVFTGR